MGHRIAATARLIPLLLLLSCSAATQASSPGSSAMRTFEARLDRLRRDHDIPGMSAAVASGDQIAWSHGFGYADLKNRIPATDTTVYHLASLTKTFASTIIIGLIERDSLSLESPVSEFGITLPSSGVIRVKHLLTHTSEGEPGAAYSYNGARFGLLGRVIEKVTGESFGARVERLIIKPLQLRHTAPNIQDTPNFRLAGVDSATFQRNVAQGYAPDGKAPIDYPRTFGAAAGLMSSAVDVARYSMAIDRGIFVRPETQALAFTPAISTRGDTLPYGMGWFVQTYRGVRLQWHYGLWTGISSLLIRVPDRKLTFVLLANSDRLSSNTTLGQGNLLSSPFAKAFLDQFVFGSNRLPH